MSGTVTLQDVADHAGVSRATASLFCAKQGGCRSKPANGSPSPCKPSDTYTTAVPHPCGLRRLTRSAWS